MELNLNEVESYKNLKTTEKNLFKIILQILANTHLLEKFFDFLVELAEKFIKGDEKKTE